MTADRPLRTNTCVLRALTLSIPVLCWAGIAAGGDGVYVQPSGKTVRMIESPDEVAVFFREDVGDVEIGSKKQSLSQKGIGELRNWPNSNGGRLRIMSTSVSPLQARSLPADHAEIETVRPIFYFEGESKPVVSSGSLVFKLRRGVGADGFVSLVEDYDLVDVHNAEGQARVFVASPADEELSSAIDLAADLAADERTLWAQPNLIRTLESRQVSGVTDTFFGEQWHLPIIQAPEAWTISRGQDVLFGMFDDAVDTRHEDLEDRFTGTGHDATLASNATGFNDPRPKIIGDRHGTAVMGIAVAEGNTLGVRGVSYLSRFTASRGLGQNPTDAQVASTYTFARQQSVDVHINSWGAAGPNAEIIVDAIKTAFDLGRDLDGDGGNAPRGMVVVFATGNAGDENVADNDYSSLPWVIGVSASNVLDRRASYSNFGPFINVLAPGGDENDLIATTDVDEANGYAEKGYSLVAAPQLDSGGRYTDTFSGTSAACPVVGGVAGLILGTNRNLTATDVRLIIEHNTDRIEPGNAEYDPLTSRSRTHGYGRVNALKSVEAAFETIDNGRRTWPERVSRPRIENNQVAFEQNFGTSEFLVLQADAEFEFIPEDQACYDCDQTGCSTPGLECDPESLDALPSGVSVLFAGCNAQEDEVCAGGRTHRVDFAPTGATKHFGIFARNDVGRYSFGVALDSDGNARDGGPEIFETPDDPIGDPGGGPTEEPLSLVINARCASVTGCLGQLVGLSPMTVVFDGNAISEHAIDSTQTAWDFDVNDAVQVNTQQRSGRYTYEAPPGEVRTFTARLTMVDVRGNAGTAEVNIEVRGGEDIGGGGGDGSVRIVAEVPGFPGSDQDRGTAPWSVVLGIDSSNITGTLQSVSWDLGDGTTDKSLSVPHTYLNESTQPINRVITATVTTISPSNTVESIRLSKMVTVDPGTAPPSINGNIGTGPLPGVPNAACGMGLLPLFAAASLMLLRRRLC